MAAADQQFLDALKFLGQQGQQYGIKLQMNDVNDRADQIRATMTDEVEQRRALRDLAIRSSGNIAGSGGSATQMAAIKNLMPDIPTTVQGAYLQGATTGDKQMVEVAKQMQNEDEERAIRAFQRKAAFQMQLEMQKEKGRNNPETMAILKENRKKYEDLMAGRQTAVETMAQLNDINGMLAHPGLIADTGPVDQFIQKFTNTGQILKQKMNKISLDNMVNMFSGMSKAVDTDNERKAFEATQLSMDKYPAANRDYIATQKKALTDIIRKADIAKASFHQTGGLSFDALETAAPERSAAYQTLPPTGAAKAFFKPAK